MKERRNDRFIVFDVETPNFCNDRMSALGVTVIQSGEIVDTYSTIVNPETAFDGFNIRLTGITPVMAEQAATFPDIWESIEPIFGGGILAAHNASFDMSVLGKCLRYYGIPWERIVPYVCTCIMGRACYPELSNHKLNTLCGYLDISLNHHEAGSDSHAAAELLLDYMRHGIQVGRYVRSFDFLAMRTVR